MSTAAVAWFWFGCLVMMSNFSCAERVLKDKVPEKQDRPAFLLRMVHFFWQGGKSCYEHFWPGRYSTRSTSALFVKGRDEVDLLVYRSTSAFYGRHLGNELWKAVQTLFD